MLKMLARDTLRLSAGVADSPFFSLLKGYHDVSTQRPPVQDLQLAGLDPGTQQVYVRPAAVGRLLHALARPAR